MFLLHLLEGDTGKILPQSLKQTLCHLQFPGEESKTQRGQVTCSRPHSAKN